MTTSRIARGIVWAASVFFAGIALAIWLAPDQAARAFGLEAVRAGGTVAVTAELGGLFGGLAAVCGAAAWTRRRPFMFAAVAMLTAVVAGRLVGWLTSGRVGAHAGALGVELVVIGALAALAARRASPEAVTASPARGRRGVAAAVAFAGLAGVAGAAMMNPDIEQRIFDVAAARQASTVDTAPLADDALRVAVCGSSAPLPSPNRAKACVAVFAGGKIYVVDAGPESVENLVAWRVPLSSIGGVLLTHFHSDHIGDLGELNLQSWAGGRPGPLAVYGGPGVDRIVGGFNEAYRLDQGYRTAHHTARVMPPDTWPMEAHTVALDGPETPAKDRSAVVLDDGTLRITAVEVDHAPISPAYAYRFDYKGRSALVTGDLKYHRPLVKGAAGVDVLVSEAISVPMTRALGAGAQEAGLDRTAAIMHDIEDYHVTPEQAATIANDAHARLLVFYHLLPAPDGPLARRVFARGIDSVRPEGWTIADDGSLYTLPIGSTDVHIGTLGE